MNRAASLVAGVCDNVVETVVIPPREQRTLPIPAGFESGPAGDWLRSLVGDEGQLWRHQALALAAIDQGRNLVIATGTASGKSLVFMAPIIRELHAGTGRTLIFYPQKALGNDQLLRFRRALEESGLDPELVGEINGDIDSADRAAVLERCRVVLATPDVTHAWLMRQAQSPRVRQFLEQLRHVVLDEAHAFEGVFGSNMAYLLRRIRCAQAEALGGADRIQWLAATATIRDAAGHLKKLTGVPFSVVDEAENGAAFHGLTLLHVNGPATGAAAERMLANICETLATEVAPNALIAFADTRQGVEHVAQYVGRDDVAPYRGGYQTSDRRTIEGLLRTNELRGVISTSALELGIDIPQFEIGLNLGVPQSRKALRQRIGRIGRAMPGAFVLIAPATAFVELGTTFGEYLGSDVEPSRLYLENPCVQIQAARCLLEETSADPECLTPPASVEWPDGFAAMYPLARPGAIRPSDLDQVLAIGADGPHHAFPLRAVREVDYVLRDIHNPGEKIGEIDLEKALREAYPGATYFHNRRAYRVVQWRTNSYDHSIMLESARGRPITHALLSSEVSVSTQADEVLGENLIKGENGEFAEILMRVADSVEGYSFGGSAQLYRDLRAKDSRMTRRVREFATTGVLLRIPEKWFAGSSRHSASARQMVAQALASVLASECNISPSEVRFACSKIAVYGPAGPRVVDDAIVIFDNIVGGLRLTSPLFEAFPSILDRLDRASEMAGELAILDARTVSRLRKWYEGLSASPKPDDSVSTTPTAGGDILIYSPGSTVGVRIRGMLQERKLVRPRMVVVEDSEMLGYAYDSGNGIRGWMPHDQVEPIGHHWSHSLWTPSTDEIREYAA